RSGRSQPGPLARRSTESAKGASAELRPAVPAPEARGGFLQRTRREGAGGFEPCKVSRRQTIESVPRCRHQPRPSHDTRGEGATRAQLSPATTLHDARGDARGDGDPTAHPRSERAQVTSGAHG